jgi:hypothetical protein
VDLAKSKLLRDRAFDFGLHRRFFIDGFVEQPRVQGVFDVDVRSDPSLEFFATVF